MASSWWEIQVACDPIAEDLAYWRLDDFPGIIGKIGSLLGGFNVNIASMQVWRKIVRGDAVMVLSVDDPLPEGIVTEITKVPGIRDAYTVTLPE